MRARPFDRLTPSQEAVCRFISKSSRWLTIYEIAKLTGVSRESARSSMRELLDRELVEERKRIFGFENGEREFHRKKPETIACMCATSRAKHRTDIFGVEPLTKKLRRILGKQKAIEFAEFLK